MWLSAQTDGPTRQRAMAACELGTYNGAARRFMNLLGSPNWISGVALCSGNTAAINRMVYGWYPYPDYAQTNCIVLFGHNPNQHSWTPIYNAIRRAQERGATLIVMDPRKSESAERADLWLPLKPGTDAAMCFGWLKVILDDELYDKAFVEKWTTGFAEFRKRVDEFPLVRVAAITGIAPELIAQAARMYATTGPAVMPWTPITDQQRNSTSAIRLMCSLRALCGYVDVPGGVARHRRQDRIVDPVAPWRAAIGPGRAKPHARGTRPWCAGLRLNFDGSRANSYCCMARRDRLRGLTNYYRRSCWQRHRSHSFGTELPANIE
ncbi:molybdopterin-dependent oxidoreductase [Variovorax guangxiensis]|uniref:molybdopterin-dependent oxidoreductase n=1 Tax=Variovorax guangxiensis TaxID=1775474 RepID=UPI00286B190B|nr:molybdopterin-dependent oxidoreductase [Variovorax guangxiensis]